MKKRKTHKVELIDCKNCVWNFGSFSYSPPIKALIEIIFDKKTRQIFGYPY